MTTSDLLGATITEVISENRNDGYAVAWTILVLELPDGSALRLEVADSEDGESPGALRPATTE